MDSSLLLHVFVFLVAACSVVPLVSRLRLGSVLGYLVAGILIGPFGLALIQDAGHVMHFAEFGVVMLLFMIGLELEPAALWRMRKSILGLGGAQVVCTSLAFTALGMWLEYDWRVSLAVGMALSLSSTALVLQMLQERNLMQTSVGENAFAVLLFQDMAVIPILILIPLLAVNADTAVLAVENSWIQGLPGYQHALVIAIVIAWVVIAGRYLVGPLLLFVAKSNLREVFTATSLALVVGITLLMQKIGVSPALGAFVSGVVLANSQYKHTLESDLDPFKGLLLGLFFISVGLGVDFNLIKQDPLALFGAVTTLIAVKLVVLVALGKWFGIPVHQNIGFAIALSQGGEFAFVLFQFASGLQVLERQAADFFTLTVAISMATTPLLLMAYGRFIVHRFMTVLPANYDTMESKDHPVIMAGYGRFGQIIGRFLNAQNIHATVLEKDADQVETLRKFGFRGYFGDATRMDLLRSAGADKAKLLIVAVDDADACLTIVRHAKREFPNLKIYARARNRRHAYELHKLGVDYFRRETFDSAITMGLEVMKALGHDAENMRLKALAFRKHDEETLRKSFEIFDNEPELISFSRQATGELEKILQEDFPVKTDEKPEKA